MIVIDASVAVKWYFPETHSDAAIDLLSSHADALFAPDIFAVEVNAALVRKGNADKGQQPGVRIMIDDFAARLEAKQVMLVRSTGAVLRGAAMLALDLGHPLKDCIYLALAMERGCSLVTCDARFVAKATGVWAQVELLG